MSVVRNICVAAALAAAVPAVNANAGVLTGLTIPVTLTETLVGGSPTAVQLFDTGNQPVSTCVVTCGLTIPSGFFGLQIGDFGAGPDILEFYDFRGTTTEKWEFNLTGLTGLVLTPINPLNLLNSLLLSTGPGAYSFTFDFGVGGDVKFLATAAPNGDPIPEPATLALLGLAIGGLGLARRRRAR